MPCLGASFPAWLRKIEMRRTGGPKHVWVSINASDVGMLSLAQELLVNKGAGLRLEFRVFRCYSGHWTHLMGITYLEKNTTPIIDLQKVNKPISRFVVSPFFIHSSRLSPIDLCWCSVSGLVRDCRSQRAPSISSKWVEGVLISWMLATLTVHGVFFCLRF